MPTAQLSPIMLLSTPTTSAGTAQPELLHEPPRFSEDIDVESTCSTPFVSAPSSPSHGSSGYFFSAPASPMHFLLSREKHKPSDYEPVLFSSDSGSFEFEFSSRFSPNGSGGLSSMTSADELFINGQIRPMKLFTHEEEDQDVRGNSTRGRDLKVRSNKYAHRKARSMSPLRIAQYELQRVKSVPISKDRGNDLKESEVVLSSETTPSCSASSSRSSSSGRNSKKWIFLKEILHRSKSEGRANNKERFWSSISFSTAKEKNNSPSPDNNKEEIFVDTQKQKKHMKVPAAGKQANGVWKRRELPSAHELHYTANRAQSEEMKKKTFLPYRQGLLGCLGFGSKSYNALSEFTRTRTPSRNSSKNSNWSL
ncbi:unnamed protein product [Fraxinus pennsylvanica]|uniref:Uncharacterized protein n=1 Tax=Fraxinus pennsylvanica TaxID=56036 RepID=A0AAD2EAR7_9LAMI|nr:unnamed protein product [Fraxinus pennsylvanica]